jgi:hypothetical protein
MAEIGAKLKRHSIKQKAGFEAPTAEREARLAVVAVGLTDDLSEPLSFIKK